MLVLIALSEVSFFRYIEHQFMIPYTESNKPKEGYIKETYLRLHYFEISSNVLGKWFLSSRLQGSKVEIQVSK